MQSEQLSQQGLSQDEHRQDVCGHPLYIVHHPTNHHVCDPHSQMAYAAM
jgi:hypothetical protein